MRFFLAVLLFGCAMPGVSLAQLAIVNTHFHEYEAGPIVSSESVFKAGDTVFFSFQIAGFKATGEEDDHVQLTWLIRATDPSNRPIAQQKTGKIEVDLAPEDKKSKWMPRVRYNVAIPQGAEAGTYLLHVEVEDEGAKEAVTKDVAVSVGGRSAVVPAESLTIRDFHFLRSENESDQLPAEGSYRPGDTVWARFEIVGYKFGTKNRYAVGYGLSLLDDAGKVIFDQPKAASDSEESFYPKQLVPAMLNLKLDPKINPGSYVLKLHVVDSVGNQEIEGAYPFRVEK